MSNVNLKLTNISLSNIFPYMLYCKFNFKCTRDADDTCPRDLRAWDVHTVRQLWHSSMKELMAVAE